MYAAQAMADIQHTENVLQRWETYLQRSVVLHEYKPQLCPASCFPSLSTSTFPVGNLTVVMIRSLCLLIFVKCMLSQHALAPLDKS